jgi:hypothetical protein
MDALYLVVEKAGDANSTISNRALEALYTLAKNCGYVDETNHVGESSFLDGVTTMLVENSDYIVDEVARRLRCLPENNTKACQVLLALLRIAKDSVLPFLDDSLEEVFECIGNFFSPLS